MQYIYIHARDTQVSYTQVMHAYTRIINIHIYCICINVTYRCSLYIHTHIIYTHTYYICTCDIHAYMSELSDEVL